MFRRHVETDPISVSFQGNLSLCSVMEAFGRLFAWLNYRSFSVSQY
jgi:hypothetical protein